MVERSYKLDVQDGKVQYLMRSGKDIVLAETTKENVHWMMQNKPIFDECIEGHADYFIHSGDYYFKGIRQQQKKRRKRATQK